VQSIRAEGQRPRPELNPLQRADGFSPFHIPEPDGLVVAAACQLDPADALAWAKGDAPYPAAVSGQSFLQPAAFDIPQVNNLVDAAARQQFAVAAEDQAEGCVGVAGQ